jgi:hypothetical protein
MHFESDTQLHLKHTFPEINPRNGYEAAENKAVCNIDHGMRPNARIGGESDG